MKKYLWGGYALLPLLLASPPYSNPAQGAILVNITEEPDRVVFDFSGSITLPNGATPSTSNVYGFVYPSIGQLAIGGVSFDLSQPPTVVKVGISTSPLPTPTINLGTGPRTFANSAGLGDVFGILGTNSTEQYLVLPFGYQSGTEISGTSIYMGESFLSLGINPDLDSTHTFTLAGTNSNTTDTVTFRGYAVPEPLTILGSSTAVLLGAMFKRHRKRKEPDQ